MDSLLLVGCTDKKLIGFLRRMGYDLIEEENGAKLKDLLPTSSIDLIILDTASETEPLPFLHFFRQSEFTKDAPIILLSTSRLYPLQVRDEGIEKVECIDAPYSTGTIITKIATQLRLRKMSGANERSATLGEMNAALRDLNDRFRKEIEEARGIQTSLLPATLPSSEMFEIGVAYRPLEEVGGDWYFILEDADKVSILTADVTGHGLSAALLGSMTKLAMFAAKKDLPHELLSEMNALMSPHLPSGRFITGNCFRFDTKTGELEYARAGAPVALHVDKAKGKINELKGEGFPIGFFEEGKYTAEKATLAPGDLLAIVTDGVTEAQNRDGAMYGTNNLGAALLETKPTESAQDTVDRILKDFTRFLDGRILKDDVTIVILKRK